MQATSTLQGAANQLMLICIFEMFNCKRGRTRGPPMLSLWIYCRTSCPMRRRRLNHWVDDSVLHSFEACTETVDDGVVAFFLKATHVHAGEVAASLVSDLHQESWLCSSTWRFFFAEAEALSMSSPLQPESTVSQFTSCCSLEGSKLLVARNHAPLHATVTRRMQPTWRFA